MFAAFLVIVLLGAVLLPHGIKPPEVGTLLYEKDSAYQYIQVVRDGSPLTIRFEAGTYNRVRAQLRDLPAPTAKMRRIRAGLLRAER